MQYPKAYAFRVVGFIAFAVSGCGSGAEVDASSTNPSAQSGFNGAAGSGELPQGTAKPAVAAPTVASANSAMVAGAADAPASASSAPVVPSVMAKPNSAATPSNMAPVPGDQPAASGGPINEACRGFDFAGLVHSPGGSVLPNKCEAFHPTLNNPYAVRCVDAWPWFRTQYPGDEYCVLPPPPDKGVQLGHHPHGEFSAWFDAVSQGDMSAYQRVPAEWVLQPGLEEEHNIAIRHTNPTGNFYRIYSRMRGGSHHMISSTTGTAPGTFTWGPGLADGLFNGTGLPTVQRPDDNVPMSLTISAEDDGLYTEFPADATVVYNMHHFNSTDRPILKEAWQNIWWTDNAKTRVTSIVGLAPLQATMPFANPGEVVDIHYASTLPAPFRVVSLYGHRHAWTSMFSAWVERSGMAPQILYQSFDWFDEPTFLYNSEVKNPVAKAEAHVDGAHSGLVMLNAGDKLHFNCHIEYTEERARQENSPVTPAQNGTLRFANQAYNAEMCILFGTAVGVLGALELVGPPPDFARVR